MSSLPEQYLLTHFRSLKIPLFLCLLQKIKHLILLDTFFLICNFSMEKIPFKLMIFVVNLPLLGCIWFARNVPCDTFQVTLEVFYSNLALPFGTRESPGVLQFQQCWYESSIFWDARKFNSEKHEYVNTLPPWWVSWVFLSFAIKLDVREKSQESKIWK